MRLNSSSLSPWLVHSPSFTAPILHSPHPSQPPSFHGMPTPCPSDIRRVHACGCAAPLTKPSDATPRRCATSSLRWSARYARPPLTPNSYRPPLTCDWLCKPLSSYYTLPPSRFLHPSCRPIPISQDLPSSCGPILATLVSSPPLLGTGPQVRDRELGMRREVHGRMCAEVSAATERAATAPVLAAGRIAESKRQAASEWQMRRLRNEAEYMERARANKEAAALTRARAKAERAELLAAKKAAAGRERDNDHLVSSCPCLNPAHASTLVREHRLLTSLRLVPPALVPACLGTSLRLVPALTPARAPVARAPFPALSCCRAVLLTPPRLPISTTSSEGDRSQGTNPRREPVCRGEAVRGRVRHQGRGGAMGDLPVGMAPSSLNVGRLPSKQGWGELVGRIAWQLPQGSWMGWG